jgi:MFS-type transporter involved in bile tolerance (Atg22 family)
VVYVPPRFIVKALYLMSSLVIFQEPRPGPKLPAGESYLTIGWKQIWIACRQYRKLPNTFIWIVAFFLLSDGLNTSFVSSMSSGAPY